MHPLYKRIIFTVLLAIFLNPIFAADLPLVEKTSIDRLQLISLQIKLLKTRLDQAQNELLGLQKEDAPISQLSLERASKNLLDKAALEISVSSSNLDSINIELADTQQSINWLEKNIQEIENQLNVLNIFGLKAAVNERANIKEYRIDLRYQQKLLKLEKIRFKYLQEMQETTANILQLKNDKYNHLSTLLKSRRMLHVKQQQVKDELAYQQLQNYWLQQLNTLSARLAKIDPGRSDNDREIYSETERAIFYANENANFAYIKSLIARYKDQIQQINLALKKNNAISVLNEIKEQLQAFNKQINRVDNVLKSRLSVLNKHINLMSQRKKDVEKTQTYLQNLLGLQKQYILAEVSLNNLSNRVSQLRGDLDQAIQNELSARQGLPTFGSRMLFDLGKEILLVPALTFQILKSLSNHLSAAFKTSSILVWSLFSIGELFLLFIFLFLRTLLTNSLKNSSIRNLNTKVFSLEWLQRNLLDIFIIGNAAAIMFFFNVPFQQFKSILYVSLVWLILKAMLTIARLGLVETTHDTAGHDVKLYYRLKWIILMGGVITAFTVFVHQLPLIYELKTLCDHLFLFLLMIVSLLLLRSWDVIPNLILSHMETQHSYLKKSIRFFGILIPLLMFGNSVVGLLGFVNLVMTVSWYEGVFLLVLVGYLISRGLLSSGMEQLSRLLIQYVNNGWLWTEAFLKPIDNLLRISLFFVAGGVLFLLYGWDKQSPIVERLTRLLHYQLVNVLNTTITPFNIIELFVVISIFYWTAKWTREFMYRMLLSRTQDMGIRNSIAILTQYSVVVAGALICLRVLGINLAALTFAFGMFSFAIGWGLRDLANNFVCGFLILLERPLRVGDIVNINDVEGEVINIGSRAVTVRTWDHMELVVPNAEIFNRSFTNWTAKDNVIRTVLHIKISRYDNPHEVKIMIQNVLSSRKDLLQEPAPEVLLKEMTDNHMDFELRYYINIRQVKSRTSVASSVLMNVWDVFAQHGIKPPHPQQEIFLSNDRPKISFQETSITHKVV